MGAYQSSENIDTILDNYKTIFEQNGLKLLQDKTNHETFILKQQIFIKKNQYELAFKNIAQRQNKNQNQNTLQMVKFWSKQHNGICSNLFKIFTVYEYPKVKLIDQIEARNRQNEYFDELQLFSILQSCLHAIRQDCSFINISPHLIFVLQQGILKLTHSDLLDPYYRKNYNEQYYYSPQKMDDFGKDDTSSNEIEKQTVFSLGMTLLHSALLKSPTHCYQISMKKFNQRKLKTLLVELQKRYTRTLTRILYQMLQIDRSKRISFDEIQDLTNAYLENSSHTLVNSFSEGPKIQNHYNTIPNINFTSNNQNGSLIYSGDTFQKNSLFQFPTSLNQSLWKKADFQIVFDQSQRQSLQKESIHLQKTIKYNTNQITNKQNIFTDPQILKMIKSGVEKINQSNTQQPTQHINNIPSKSSLLKSNISNSLPDYEILQSRKAKCTFVVQTYPDNSRFQGMMQDGMKNGYGKLTYQDGVYYEGNFKNDTLHGKGSLFYGPNRPAYIGEWINNKFNGIGILYNEYPCALSSSFDYRDFNKIQNYWIKFDGCFKQDCKQGGGRIYLTNGQTIQNTFQKGMMKGQGVFMDMDNKQIKGQWSDNIFIQPK